MNKRRCKTISFDLTDDIEMMLLEFAEGKGNFSRYIKRLIEKDKNGRCEFSYIPVIPLEESENDDSISDHAAVDVKELDEMPIDILEGFI